MRSGGAFVAIPATMNQRERERNKQFFSDEAVMIESTLLNLGFICRSGS